LDTKVLDMKFWATYFSNYGIDLELTSPLIIME